jgi:hypothetical protein
MEEAKVKVARVFTEAAVVCLRVPTKLYSEFYVDK